MTTPVTVGREPGTPLAKVLKDQLRVSRTHVEVTRTGDRVLLVDRSSLGTFREGRELPKGQPQAADLPVVLDLADQATIRIEPDDHQ